jgi:hypothetical protein
LNAAWIDLPVTAEPSDPNGAQPTPSCEVENNR